MATEEPKYTVESKTDPYEIRKYNSILVAETKVDTEFGDAGNKAFRILADFIFGNNKSKTKIDMTAPVTQQGASEKIEMTAPVSQLKTTGGFIVQFTMPEKFTLDTLPEPNDSRVKIREIPARKLAVYPYSGSWSEARYQEKLGELLLALKANGVQTTGEPIFSRYNSPFKLWFLRRNEIWIEVVH
jgi:effector-binding domain-containing protein